MLGSLRRTPFAAITTPGLTAIACSVALLWGVLLSERDLVAKATEERARVIRSIEKQRVEKNHWAAPDRAFPHSQRALFG